MRPILHPDKTAVMPPRLCGSAELYAACWAAGSYSQDWERRFDKREKGTHRFTIADTRGRLDLTVPIAKPASSRCAWDEIEISTHGAWWDAHRVALESAYGRTPYFEFYADRFVPMLTAGVEDRFPTLKELATAWESEIADILGLRLISSLPAREEDAIVAHAVTAVPAYRQVRADRLGFIAGLSILDLIFNLGPEAQMYLHRLAREYYS